MKIAPTKKYAVITGDIVDSSKLSKTQRKQLPAQIAKASRDTRDFFGAAVPMEVDVFRGDGWQLIVSEPTASLRVGLFFRACLRTAAKRGRGLDTRLAIAIGTVDFVGDRVSGGDGEAYRLSGRLLEQIPGKQRLQIALPGEAGDDAIAVIVRLIDVIARGWTGRQAQAVCGALRGWTQEKIAGSWPGKVSQQAVTKHLDAANWPALEEALILVETRLGKL